MGVSTYMLTEAIYFNNAMLALVVSIAAFYMLWVVYIPTSY